MVKYSNAPEKFKSIVNIMHSVKSDSAVTLCLLCVFTCKIIIEAIKVNNDTAATAYQSAGYIHTKREGCNK